MNFNFLAVIKFLLEQGPILISAVVGVLSALIALSMLIPGEQPEKFLQGVVDFLSKFSKKPKELDKKVEPKV